MCQVSGVSRAVRGGETAFSLARLSVQAKACDAGFARPKGSIAETARQYFHGSRCAGAARFRPDRSWNDDGRRARLRHIAAMPLRPPTDPIPELKRQVAAEIV